MMGLIQLKQNRLLIHENMNKPQKPFAKWREPDAKDFLADDFPYTKYPEKANLQIQEANK